MRRLGEHLIDQRILTSVQLDEALQSQVAFGARLGTNLVELGHLDMQMLSTVLASFLRAPVPPESWLESIDKKTLRSVPLHLVKQHKLLPLRLEEGTLHVAMLDPTDSEQLTALAAATRRRIQPYVLPEASMYFWLERHYGLARGIRYLNVDPTVEIPAAAPAIESVAEVSPLEAGQELTDEQTFLEVYESKRAQQPPSGVVRPVALHVSQRPSVLAATLEARLREARDRDQIIDAALSLAELHGRAVALFLVHRQFIQGLRGGAEAGPVDGVMLPLGLQSLLTAAAASREPQRGAPTGEQDLRILRSIGRTDVREVAVLPIEIRNRVVNLLYVDNGPEPISHTSYAALLALTECMALAYERLILERKKES